MIEMMAGSPPPLVGKTNREIYAEQQIRHNK
jgi:hypothetical protein